MKTKFTQTLLAIGLASGIMAGMLIHNTGAINTLLVQLNILQVKQQASYAALPYEELINTADVIFVGKLIEISPTKWNQDSGEYWGEEAIQYYTLRFEVSEFVEDKIGANNQKTIEITVLGPSLLDGNTDYNLQIGDEVLVFAGQTNLAWCDSGTKSVITLKTDPSLSFFIQNPNGNYEGQTVRLLGKGQFTVDKMSLPLPNFIAQIRGLLNKPPSP